MLDTTLPIHPRTGLQAVGLRRDGRPIWPILGGSGEGDSGDSGPKGDADADSEDGQDDGDDQGDGRDGDGQDDADDTDDLGDKGKKALRELRRENRQLKSQLREKSTAKKPAAEDDQGDDPDAVRERAREEARAEVWGERVEAAAIAAAAGRLANPQLAARLLDLSDITPNDKGRPDRDAISELIDDLLEDEPYLAAQSAKDSGRRFQGGADGGARKTPKKTAGSLDEAIANRLVGKAGG